MCTLGAKPAIEWVPSGKPGFLRILLAALHALPIAASAEPSWTLPTRSECIASFAVKWTNESIDEIEEAHSILNEAVRELGRAFPLAGLVFGDGSQSYYLQFAARCHDKTELTEDLLRRWRHTYPKLPRSVVGTETVTPSTKTIQLTGPAWRD